MIIAFVSPVGGQTGNTTNMATISTTLGMDQHNKILLMHEQCSTTLLEQSFGKATTKADMFQETSGGMDGMNRLVSCGMLEAQGIKDNAITVLRERLDMIIGGTRVSKTDMIRNLIQIFKLYRKSYDLLFVDAGAGITTTTKTIIDHADLVVVNVNQNLQVLREYKQSSEWTELLTDKKVIYCAGNFEGKSRISKDRIAREIGVTTKKVGLIPRHYKLADAQTDGGMVNYLLRSRSQKKKFLEYNEEAIFIESVRYMIKLIFDSLEMRSMTEDEMYA